MARAAVPVWHLEWFRIGWNRLSIPLKVRAIAYNPKLLLRVTLNLFQGPSGLTAGARRLGGITPAASKIRTAALGAKWALKRVQGDE
jgi:hypothetical protein